MDSKKFTINSLRKLPDAILNSKLWSQMVWPCNFIGWSMNRVQPDTDNCCKRWGITSRGKKISSIKRPWETNFSPKFRPTRGETAEQTASQGILFCSFLTCAVVLMPILVSLATVFWHVTQRSPKERDFPKDGCEGDYTSYSKMVD